MVYYSQHEEGNMAYHGYGEVRAERNGYELECVSYAIDDSEYYFDIYKQKDENNNIHVFFEISDRLKFLCNDASECQCAQVIREAYNFAQKYTNAKLIIDDSKHRCRNAKKSS